MTESVLVTKEFAGIKAGEVLELLTDGKQAFKIKKANGTIAFLPKSHGELRPTVVPPEPPRPTTDPSPEELEMMRVLTENAGVAETEGLLTDPEPMIFETPKTDEEKAIEAKALEDAKEIAKLQSIRKGLQLQKSPALEPHQFWLTDLTAGRLPKSQKDYIVQAYDVANWPEESQADIPELMLAYHWDADVLEALVLGHQFDEKVLIVGLPGTGKTTAIRQYAAQIQQPYMRFNGKDGIEQSSFLGSPWATSAGMEWRDGLLPQGCKMGYLTCIDEVFKIPAGIQMAMQNLYEKGGSLILDDKPGGYHDKLVVPAPEFRLFLTDNVRGTGDNFEKFASTQVQDSSTLDRFGITVEQHYLPADQEAAMLQVMYPSVAETQDGRNVIKSLVKFAGLVRAGYKQGEISLTLSPRGLMAALTMIDQADVPAATALELAYTNKLAEEAEIQAASQMRATVGGF